MFYEMRSAAADLRGRGLTQEQRIDFTRRDNINRITAQIETLKRQNVRHVVLSAFGCGAFENDPTTIAEMYVEVISQNIEHFDVIAFAIYTPYGSDNYTPFLNVFSQSVLSDFIVANTSCAVRTINPLYQ